MGFGDTGSATMAPPNLAVPDPNNYSPTPALDQLEAAYQKGLIGVGQIQALVSHSQDAAANSATDANTIQQAKLQMGINPSAAALSLDQIKAARSLVPGQTELTKAQAALTTAQTKGQLYPANYMAEIMRQVYGGDPSGLPSPSSSSTPVPSASGAPSGAAAPSATAGSALAPTSTLPPDVASSIKQNYSTAQFNGYWLQQPQWKSLMDTAKTKQGGEQALYDSSGYLKPFSQAVSDISNLPPVLDQGARTDVLNQMNSVMDIASRVPGILDILNDPNSRVGPGMGQGEPITNTLNKWRSKFSGVPVLGSLTGANSAADKVSDQNKLMQFSADQIQSTIRSLAGTGNRVMQAEVKNDDNNQGLFYRAMPKLSDPPQTWKDYLTNRLQFMRHLTESASAPLTPADQQQYLPVLNQLDESIDALKGSSKVANPYSGSTVTTGPVSAPGATAPVATAAKSAPPANAVLVTSPDQLRGLKPGTVVRDAQGNWGTVPAPSVASQ